MPLYEDLVERALAAQNRARSLHVSSQRISRLAAVLREAHAGHELLVRCAWCGRLQIGGEWLRLEAIGSGQMRIAEGVVRRSTHGICPDCFARVSDKADADRGAAA